MRHPKIPCALAVLAVGSACHFEARAESTPASMAAAETLFREGKALLGEKNYAAACPKLIESQRLDPGTGTLLTVALCHEGQGKIASAWAEFHEALAQARVAGREDRIAMAKEHIASLEPKLSRLVIRADRGTGARVVRDGDVVGEGALDTALPIDPGDHVIESSAAGRQTWTQHVNVTDEGRVFEIRIPTLAPTSEKAPTGAEAAPIEEHVSTGRVVAYAVGGAGIAAALVGGIFGVQAISKSHDAKGRCPGDLCDDPSALSENDDARAAAMRSNVFLGAGGVLLVTGAVLWFTEPATNTRGLAASLGPNGGSIRWMGRF